MSRIPGPEIDCGPTVPGWAVHLGLAAAAVGVFLAAAAGTGLPVGVMVTVILVIVVTATVGSAVRGPGYLTLGLSLFPATVAMLTLAPVGYTWRTPVLMVAIHATVRLSWYATHVLPATRVELAVLGAEGPRFVVINCVGQAVALLAGAVTAVTEQGSGPASTGTGWAGVLGAVALLALALALRGAAVRRPLTSR